VVEAAGGRLYSYTVARRPQSRTAEDVPYIIAAITRRRAAHDLHPGRGDPDAVEIDGDVEIV
jgi:uncharacterized OB-fold protein